MDIRQERLKGLDGLRALAIGATVWMHLAMAGAFATQLPLWLGRQGVCLFFALSGYLITLSLLKDASISRFYYRRARKIFPAFYTYLAAVFILCRLGIYRVVPGMFAAAATYLINWYGGSVAWPLLHLWSLAVEEQFYLTWPLALRTLGHSRAMVSIFVLLLAWPWQRWLRLGRFGHVDAADALFSATYDTILWGCLAALIQKRHPKATRASCKGFVLPVLVLALASVYTAKFWPVATIPLARGMFLSWTILWITENGESLATRCLEIAPLKWIGRRSYSLYLWHLIFCDARLHQKVGLTGSLLGMVLASALSHRLLEPRTEA